MNTSIFFHFDRRLHGGPFFMPFSPPPAPAYFLNFLLTFYLQTFQLRPAPSGSQLAGRPVGGIFSVILSSESTDTSSAAAGGPACTDEIPQQAHHLINPRIQTAPASRCCLSNAAAPGRCERVPSFHCASKKLFPAMWHSADPKSAPQTPHSKTFSPFSLCELHDLCTTAPVVWDFF